MRGCEESQGYMFSYVSPEQRVPGDHPLRSVKTFADDILRNMSRTFDRGGPHSLDSLAAVLRWSPYS